MHSFLLGTARVVLATVLGVLLSPAYARQPPRDLLDFEHWVVDNLNCKDGVDFMEEVQSRVFLDRAKALGVKVTTDWQEGDTPDGEFVLPNAVQIGRQAATQVRYWGDSGAEFYAIVRAPAEVMTKALRTKPVPPKLSTRADDKTVGMRFTHPAARDGSLAPAVFVRRGEAEGTSEVGCRYFDG
jgi:hypothetical protein